MKLPRDLSGRELVKRLGKHGYEITRQTGSHIRLTHPGPPKHSITVPAHDVLKTGTLSSIAAEVAAHLKIRRNDVLGS